MTPGEPEETYLTVAEVAETLKLNQQTVRNWIDQGSLPALRVGRRVRIKRSDFQRVLEESYSAGTAAASRQAGPSADDFWGGEPVGVAEPGPGPGPDDAAETDRGRVSEMGPEAAEVDPGPASEAGPGMAEPRSEPAASASAAPRSEPAASASAAPRSEPAASASAARPGEGGG